MKEDAKIFQITDPAGRPFNFHNKRNMRGVMQHMANWFSILLLLSIPFLCASQVGLNVKGFIGQSKTLDTVHISQDGLQASVEYNFRLKQKRIEFRPGLGYRFTLNGNKSEGNISSIDFDMNTAVYPFDYAGDCHCPTFSKGGKLFKKGFFFEFNPGVGYQLLSRLKSDPDDPSRLPIRSKNLQWKLGGSVGLDIGLSDKFTFTPLLSISYLTASKWEGLRSDGSEGQLIDYSYFGAGIRITHNRDDHKARRRY